MVAETTLPSPIDSPGGRPFRKEGFVDSDAFDRILDGILDGPGSLVDLTDVPARTWIAPDTPQWYDDHAPVVIDPATRTIAIGQVASGRVEPGVIVVDVDTVEVAAGRLAAGYLHPEFEEDAAGLSDDIVNELLTEIFLDDALAEVMQRLDPHGELDPDHELLAECAMYALEMHGDYSGMKDFPRTFLRDLYERDLVYVAFRDEKLDEILALNASLGIAVEEVYVIDDFDRSQVAVVDPQRKSTGDAKKDAELGKMRHRVRPGWGYWTRRAARRLRKQGIVLRQGAISDRMQHFDPEQTHDTSGKSLVDIAYDHFREAGIERFASENLVISSTDGDWVKDVEDFMKPEMRKKARYTKAGRPFKVSQKRIDAKEAKRKEAIAEISTPERIADKRLDYHDKVGAMLILSRRAPPGTVILWFDDASSTRLVHSPRIMGGHIDKAARPLLPDDEHQYDGFVGMKDLLF